MQLLETEHLAGRLFMTAGNSGITRYPNLLEMHKYYPCGEPAMCDHARIEPDLLHAVLYNGGMLRFPEILRLAKLYNCPIGVLNHPKTVMLDIKKLKHRKMIAEVDNFYKELKCIVREGNQEAEKYLKWAN